VKLAVGALAALLSTAHQFAAIRLMTRASLALSGGTIASALHAFKQAVNPSVEVH
jgi:hypothetical protein